MVFSNWAEHSLQFVCGFPKDRLRPQRAHRHLDGWKCRCHCGASRHRLEQRAATAWTFFHSLLACCDFKPLVFEGFQLAYCRSFRSLVGIMSMAHAPMCLSLLSQPSCVRTAFHIRHLAFGSTWLLPMARLVLQQHSATFHKIKCCNFNL